MRDIFDQYMGQCLPMAEKEILSAISDDIVRYSFEESRRYAGLNKVRAFSPINVESRSQGCPGLARQHRCKNPSLCSHSGEAANNDGF